MTVRSIGTPVRSGSPSNQAVSWPNVAWKVRRPESRSSARVPVRAARRQREGPRGVTPTRRGRVERLEQRQEIVLVRPTAVQQHERAVGLAVCRPDAVYELVRHASTIASGSMASRARRRRAQRAEAAVRAASRRGRARRRRRVRGRRASCVAAGRRRPPRPTPRDAPTRPAPRCPARRMQRLEQLGVVEREPATGVPRRRRDGRGARRARVEAVRPRCNSIAIELGIDRVRERRRVLVERVQTELGGKRAHDLDRDPAERRVLAARDREHAAGPARQHHLALGRSRLARLVQRAGRAARRSGSARAPDRRRRPQGAAGLGQDARLVGVVRAHAAGSPSYGSSVVPSTSMPSYGSANETRTRSSGTVTAEGQRSSVSSTRCAPFESWMLVPARASSSRRSVSTQGPVALTTARVRMVSCSPWRADVDAGRPGRRARRGRRPRSASRSWRAQAAAARATAITRRASSVWWSW